MADKTLPPGGLSGGHSTNAAARRIFLRRAVGVGVPVVLATVRGRSVLAQGEVVPTASGCASMTPSGWRNRTYGDNDEPCAPFDADPNYVPPE